MNIEGSTSIRYEALDNGSVFKKYGRVMIKTDNVYGHECAVDIKTGEAIFMLKDDSVYPCKGKFVIEDNL